jgi:hypothetical protein
MSGVMQGLGKVFQSVGSTVSKVASSVGTIGKTTFAALTAQAAPPLAQGGAQSIAGCSNGTLGNILKNVTKQAGYGSMDAAQSLGQQSTFNAMNPIEPVQQAAQVAQAAPQQSGFGAMLKSPLVPGLLQGLGSGLNARADRQHQSNESQKQLDFQQKNIDDVRNSYNINPQAYQAQPARPKPRFAYRPETGQIENM